jgi:mechanosensitive ion channel-like protein
MQATIDFQGGLEEAWAHVATFVPKLLGFFIILLIGWFVAKALSKLADRLFERIGFDRWVERGSVRAAFQRANTEPSDVIGVIVFWTVFLLVLQLAFGIWGPNPVSDLIEGIIGYLPNLIVAIVILVIASAIARVVTDVLRPMLGSVEGGETMARAAGIAILVLGVFAALDQLEVAPAIVNGLFYALLIVVVGSLVVAFGGGGIPVARRYLERWSAQVQRKKDEIVDAVDADTTTQPSRSDATSRLG